MTSTWEKLLDSALFRNKEFMFISEECVIFFSIQTPQTLIPMCMFYYLCVSYLRTYNTLMYIPT